MRDVGLFVSTVAVLLESLSLKRWFIYKSCAKSQAAQTAVPESYHVLKLWGHNCHHTRAADFSGTVLAWTAIGSGPSIRRETCDDKEFSINQSFQMGHEPMSLIPNTQAKRQILP